MQRVILPGSTIGVLGSGQLGRMFAIAARRMGYRVHTYSPDDDTPTGQVADYEWKGDYADADRIREFASAVDVITFEFENVPADAARAAAEITCVRPQGSVLHTTQHRLREKNFLAQRGFPLPPWRAVRSATGLAAALGDVGAPAVLKTAGWGYDGKGQVRLDTAQDAIDAWTALQADEAVVEAFVDFEAEVSVLGARGIDGRFEHFGLFENKHRRHILDTTVTPSRFPPEVETEAVKITEAIMDALDVVGVLCVEFFLTRPGNLLVNELAPRPHNSGHVTFDGYVTSQFEQQLRAICGLPLGSTQRLCPVAMANLLGDLWQNGEPNWHAALQIPNVKLHLYGKEHARPGRKMGHLTALAATPEAALETAVRARDALVATVAAR